MNTGSRSTWRIVTVFTMLLALISPLAKPATAAIPAPAGTSGLLVSLAPSATNWCLAGSFQGWNNSSHPLNDAGTGGDLFAGDGVFSLDYTISTAGDSHEFKIVECGNWANAFPPNNAWVNTAVDNQVVKFTFDTNDHSSDAGAIGLPAVNIIHAWDSLPASFTAVGDFQAWNNADPAARLTDVGGGYFRLAYNVPVAGSYVGKVTETGSWDDQYGSTGRSIDSGTIPFTTTADNQTVIFLLDTWTSRLTVTPNTVSAGNWCLAGGFQGWNNASDPLYDDGAHGDLIGGDGIFSLDYTIPNAGREEWKVVECANWSVAYPTANAWVETTAPGQIVKFTFDINNHAGDAGAPLLPAQNIVHAWDSLPASFNAVGSFNGWDNADPAATLANVGGGWQMVGYPVAAAGTYQGKLTRTGNWDDQYGADGRSVDAQALNFTVNSNGDVVHFLLNSREGRMAIIPPPPPASASHDDNVWWDQLGHDSRDPLYRTPAGPQPAGTPVTLRLRAASGDLTAARVRVYNDRLNTQTFYDMSIAADDGVYEWWQATLPPSADPTVYWYRFIAIDGADADYYEDDSARTGGWGTPFDESVDNSWQLTFYDPAFHTPDWVKNAIIYQVFTDRFRDGDPGNDTPAGTFFYDEAGGTIVRSNTSDWSQPVCDPRDAADCPGTYSKNFYGGDLQGLLDKLDYLQLTGVTAIYLNPIFESPSNHKYDTTDFSVLDDNFGNLALFQELVYQANRRGMKIILDGVFNHTSSDSIYFDRYGRYPEVGACESPDSPFRDWYFFTDVSAGSGPCVGSDGTPDAATYTSWFGYESLPKLNSANPQVRDLIWSGGPDSIARYWMQWADGWRLDVGGDVDPGTTNDAANDYWEGFRDAIHQTNPEAYIVGEEWGNATSWTLGGEWDATMNYQYSSAMLGFWRDTPFVDNDHNSGSSAGPLNPLTPSQLDERLQNWKERYAPEAYYAMMNLLGSHDTNRPLFMLDHYAAVGTDQTLLDDPGYDWSDAITRLKGVVILQMTLPGAPTIYYGDEIGLVGPVTYDGASWQDDPYNRQPYPWTDESGAPLYTHLQTYTSQQVLRSYYRLLTSARNNHPALRTGSFDTLLVDDANLVYAYGRKLADHSDSAVVIVNRAASAQSISVDVSGYLPYGAWFHNVLNSNSLHIVDGSGLLTLDVPAMSGAVLVQAAAMAAPPAAVDDLAVTDERNGEVDLDWSAASGASSYDVYRSLVSGGGYELIANTASTSFTDSGLSNAVTYYYVVVSRNDANGLASARSNEAAGTPQYDLTLAWFNLQWPYEITHTISAVTPTVNIYGQIWIDGVTSLPGATQGLMAQVGFGAPGTAPDTGSWTWVDMAFNADTGNNDEYAGNLLPDALGDYDYTTRYSSNGGQLWYYADRDGPGYDAGRGGLLHVIPGSDTTAPGAPQNLAVTGTTAGSITLGWDANPEPDLAGYDIYRSEVVAALAGVAAPQEFAPIARVSSAASSYTDTDVIAGGTYEYYLLAFDTSFNFSAPSATAQGTAEPRMVEVSFVASVPSYTPGTVYMIGNIPGYSNWDTALEMTEVATHTWSITLSLLDSTALEYKFRRSPANWDSVEKEADGNTEIPNRAHTVSYGASGQETVNHSVAGWRDPIVLSHFPAAGATAVLTTTQVTVTWSQSMPDTSDFLVEGPSGAVAGVFAYDDAAHTVTFTPAEALAPGAAYTITVSGKTDAVGDVQQVPLTWAFTTTGSAPGVVIYLPVVY